MAEGVAGEEDSGLQTLRPRQRPPPKGGPRWVYITGASRGIGFHAALELARRGDRVVMGARDEASGEKARQRLVEKVPEAKVHLAVGDLATREGTRQASDAALRLTKTLDVLVLNAGLSHPRRKKSKDGVELTFAVNHLSAFRTAHHMHDALKRSDHARVLVVASHAHRSAKLRVDDLELKHHRFSGWNQYCNTKLMNLLFTMALVRRWRDDGITVNALHPGVVATGIARNWLLGRVLFKVFGTPPKKGADTLVYLATDPIARKVTGQYFAERQPLSPKRLVFDEPLQERLWSGSEAYGV